MTRARDVANLIGSGNYSSTTFTATAGQTAFTISHTQGFIQVFMNGLLLDETVDYTSNGSAVTLTSGAAAGDEIEVVAYNTFSVGDAITQTAADTRYVNTTGDTVTGALTVDTSTTTNLTVDSANYGGIQFKAAGTDTGYITSYTNGSGTESMYMGGADNVFIHTGTNHGLTNGTTRLGIDSSGRVTMPNQPAFKAYLSSTHSNVTGNAPVHSTGYLWTSVFNIGSHFNGSGTFTAPVAGRYLFAGHWALNSTTMGDASYHTFPVNGVTSSGYASSGLSMFDPRSMEWDQNRVNFGGTSILSLSANDTVTMYGGNLDTSASVDIVGGNVWHTTMFSGYLIG